MDRYDHDEFDVMDCPYDESYNANPPDWQEPEWDSEEIQHPDTGWYLTMRWNEYRNGHLYITVRTVSEQYYDGVEDLTDEEISNALETHHDMVLFAHRISGFYETYGKVRETLMNEGFKYYDL